jgi:hypothetical protein
LMFTHFFGIRRWWNSVHVLRCSLYCGGPVISKCLLLGALSFSIVCSCVLVEWIGWTLSEERVVGSDGWFVSAMKRLCFSIH